MELNKEQIIKQMQDWSNGICENACLKGECLNGIIVACENCMPNTVRNALSLITSQEQRIKELTEENERLSQSIANSKSILANNKADTVRKMQERLKKWFGDDLQRVYSNYNIHRYIDGITKEILEGL